MKTCREVNTKSELKKAVKDRVDGIIISKQLEKEIEPLIKVMQMSEKKRNALIAFLSASGAAIIAALAAIPTTAGISGITSAIVAMPAVAAFSISSGIEIALLVLLILLCLSVGISTIIELIRMYTVREQTIHVGYDTKTGKIKFEKRTEYN